MPLLANLWPLYMYILCRSLLTWPLYMYILCRSSLTWPLYMYILCRSSPTSGLVVLPLSLVTLSYRARRRARQSAWVTFSSRSMGSVRAQTSRLSKGRLATRRFVTAPTLIDCSKPCMWRVTCMYRIVQSRAAYRGCTVDVRIWSPGRTHLTLVRAAHVWLHVGVRYVYGMAYLPQRAVLSRCCARRHAWPSTLNPIPEPQP